MRKMVAFAFAMNFVPGLAYADPNVDWCKTDTGIPTHTTDTVIKMPDGKLRGTRNAATLYAEALTAKKNGNCSAAVEWLIHCQEGNETVKNSFRANPTTTCAAIN